jgi:hypothetical protein
LKKTIEEDDRRPSIAHEGLNHVSPIALPVERSQH